MAKSPLPTHADGPIAALSPSRGKSKPAEPAFEQRGPDGHEMRARIVDAADALFVHFGFEKTSVADIAREVGISSAYVYRFFDSKAAIGEAVAGARLQKIQDGFWAIARKPLNAEDKFKDAIEFLMSCSLDIFLKSKRLHELTTLAIQERWPSIARHKLEMKNAIRNIIMDGQAEGVFARGGDADSDAAAIVDGLYLVAHPLILEEMVDDDLDLRARRLAAFFLRALKAPPPAEH